jgi:hypothetical protein
MSDLASVEGSVTLPGQDLEYPPLKYPRAPRHQAKCTDSPFLQIGATSQASDRHPEPPTSTRRPGEEEAMTATFLPTETALRARALAAYYRAPRGIAGTPTDIAHRSLDGRAYVVLASDTAVLAVYRITNSGQLRRLRRWPAELVHTEGRNNR